MTPPAPARLSSAALRPVVEALWRRFGESERPVSITVPDAPAVTRQAVADLLGLDRLPPPRLVVRVDRLLGALALGSVIELRESVEAVAGPVIDQRGIRARRRSEADELWTWWVAAASALSVFPSVARAAAWAESQRSLGARGGLEVHRDRLTNALAVLAALPADGIALPVLAETCTGDPHGLDRGRSLAAIVVDGLAAATGLDRAPGAEAIRALWERVGVVPDQLSSTVLALGLPADAHPLGRFLGAAGDAGEPVVLTLAQLRRWPRPSLPVGAAVYVFENPSVVAEAVRRGVAGVPIICSSGRPTVAVVTLLRQLTTAGAEIRQHADIDIAGLGITAWLMERVGAMPWRMSANDYLSSIRVGDRTIDASRVPATPWDPALAEAIRERRVPLYEETVTGLLLDQL